MMWKKRTACICAAAIIATGLGSVPIVSLAESDDVKNMSGEITFSFWGIPEEVAVQEMIVEAFNEEYPNKY